MPRPEPTDPTPPPLDLPTPAPDARGVIDLSHIVEAAKAAAGCGFEDVDEEYWYVTWDWRAKRDDNANALLAAWHGVRTCNSANWDGAETLTLASSPRVLVEVSLTETSRGLWLAASHVRTPAGSTGRGAWLQDAEAYVDRETALRYRAYDAWCALDSGHGARYVRLLAQVQAHCGDLVGEAA